MTLEGKLKHKASQLGFALVGIVPVSPTRTHGFYQNWLGQGHAGKMGYLHRHAGFKRDPALLLPTARSLIALAHPYPGTLPPEIGGESLRGRVSRYALGQDYHDVLKTKLHRLAGWLGAESGGPLEYRAMVDSAPLMEREFAARAGLGWVGKNAMLIHWELGSWVFLAELLVDLELAADVPPRPRAAQGKPGDPLDLRESCGTCTACIEACPTGAIVANKTVDSRRCISYLTIELKGAIAAPLREPMGDWVFGCDICQEVCPWNRKAPPARETAFEGATESSRPSLIALLALDEAAFRERYRGTPLGRPKRRGILRNAAIALGNLGAKETRPGMRASARQALSGALMDPEPLVRGAAAWALGRLEGDEPARGVLMEALDRETEGEVREELRAALAGTSGAINIQPSKNAMVQAEVVSIHVCPGAGDPMQTLAKGVALAGEGLAGDRYLTRTGTYSKRHAQDREITLIQSETLADLQAELGTTLAPEETRRNLVTRGISLDGLYGRRFGVGKEVVLEGVRECLPCGYLERITGKKVFAALQGRGGLRAIIVQGGVIRPGDRIEPLPETAQEPAAAIAGAAKG